MELFHRQRAKSKIKNQLYARFFTKSFRKQPPMVGAGQSGIAGVF
jgi:predicted helicase